MHSYRLDESKGEKGKIFCFWFSFILDFGSCILFLFYIYKTLFFILCLNMAYEFDNYCDFNSTPVYFFSNNNKKRKTNLSMPIQ